MKIAFVANTCWNIYNFRKGLVQYFLTNGDEVIVLAPEDEYTEEVKKWGCTFFDTPLEGTGTNPIKDFSYMQSIRKVFKSERPSVALSYTIKSNIYSSLAGKSTKIPVICNVSGLGTVFLVKGLTGKLAINLYRLAFRYASAIFFQNKDDQKLFTSIVHVDPGKLYQLPGSGINLSDFKVASTPKNEMTYFLMISRVITEKGVKEFAEAASFFQDREDVRFTLVGKYDESHARSIEREELKKWQDRGWLFYHQHSDNIKELIATHHVIVLPSYREGTPRTLLEGAAMGRPLITTDVPGCREVVEDGFNGFLCDVRNAKSLRDKMRLYLSLNEDEKQKLASNSRALVEQKFDEQLVIDSYAEVIRRITANA